MLLFPTIALAKLPDRIVHHRPGCESARCDHHADRLYNAHKRKHREAREANSMSALEQCVITNESKGNPQAVSGVYMGIGQWEDSRWLSDGGGRYGATPLDASYAQQERILRGEGEAGMIEQQGQYDGCG